MASLRIALLSLLLVLAGCAGTPAISDSTWRQVDQEILLASRGAAEQARQQALADMQRWMDLVYRKTDEDFIPWFSSYWTQQWLGIKVSWYKLGSTEATDPSARRLARHLQEEYEDQVLEPVARTLAPPQILDNATRVYVRQLDLRLPPIRERYAIPSKQFVEHLKQIPAIAQPPGASLYQVLQAKPLDRLPAYRSLLKGIHPDHGDWSSQPQMLDLAEHTSQQLAGEMAGSGSASLVGIAAGPAFGIPLSLGVAIFQANARAKRRSETEARLRKGVREAFDAYWLAQLRNREHGVMAGVNHLSEQIERQLQPASP